MSAGSELYMHGSLQSSLVTVEPGSSFFGHGSIAGALSISGVTAPLIYTGSFPLAGLLSVGSLSMESGSGALFVFEGDTRGSGYGAIDVAGDLSYGGILELFNVGGFTDNTTYHLLTGNVVPGSHFETGVILDLVAGQQIVLTSNGLGDWSAILAGGQLGTFSESTGDFVIGASAVPEPGAWMSSLALLSSTGFLRRRRASR